MIELSRRRLIGHNSYRTIRWNYPNRNTEMQPKCYSVIIAGGKGTFLAAQPLPTAQTTVEDLGPTKPYQRNSQPGVIHQRTKQTLVVTVAEQLNALCKELPNLPRRIFWRNLKAITPPCIGWRLWKLSHGTLRRDGSPAADHWVADVNGFRFHQVSRRNCNAPR